MLDRITKAMRFAADHGIHAAFFGVDSTRAEPDFYERVYASAVEAGAKEVVVVDTLGIASPEAVAELVGRTVELVDVPVHFHGHNDFGVATASAVAAVRAGAAYVHGTINGMGERAGNANLGEVALTLRALYGVETNLRLDRIREVVGARARAVRLRARAVEAGDRRDAVPARVAARSRRSSTTRSRSSRTRRSSSRTERSIVLGKKSGLDSIRIKADELGLDVPGGAARRGARGGEEARRRAAAARHRRRVQGDRWLTTTRSSSARASTASRALRCSRRAAGTCACSSATTGSAARSGRRRSPSRASSTTCSAPGIRSGSAARRMRSSATTWRGTASST